MIYLGFDRRGGGNSGNRNGTNYNNNNNTTNPRPSRFSNKRSRSRSPVRPSRFDNNSNGNDFKRARTDSARPSHVSLYCIFSKFYHRYTFRMNLLNILIQHQPMEPEFIHNEHIKNLNQTEQQHHLVHHYHHHPQLILIVDFIIKWLHIHHHQCTRQAIKCMHPHPNNHHYHQVHPHHK